MLFWVRTGQKQSMIITRSTFNYAAPCWSLNVSKTNWNKLESKQNKELRVVTGCTKMTHIDYLRQETRHLTVENHCKVWQPSLQSQFMTPTTIAMIYWRNPPINGRKRFSVLQEIVKNVWSWNGNSKGAEDPTQQSRWFYDEKQWTQQITSPDSQPNPEELDRGEPGLSREERKFLSEMRSSYCPLLDFKNKINSDESDTCRKCHKERESAAHVAEQVGGIKCEDRWWSSEKSISRLEAILV